MGFAMVELGIISFKNRHLETLFRMFVTNETIARFGSWSYSTYLIHIPIFSIVIGGFALLFGGVTQHLSIVLLILCFPLVLLCSWISFTLIEKPFNLIGRRFAGRLAEADGRGRPALRPDEPLGVSDGK